jgi:hypothetical protein
MHATLVTGTNSPTALTARMADSGFRFSRRSYNALSVASDGAVYYVLSSNSIDHAAQMYRYDPWTGEITHLGDLTGAAGENGRKTIPQGKSHVRFCEADGKLYFATHVSYYTIKDGRETIGEPPPGYEPYSGGHFLAYDLATGEFEDIAKVPGQGIITMAMDAARGRLYGLTWPKGIFIAYDLAAKEMIAAPVSGEGEAGEKQSYQAVCRAMVADPRDGSVYFTIADGRIVRYRYSGNAIEVIHGDNLRKDYFGSYHPNSPFHMSYHWRQAVWHPDEEAIYAVHGNSGYLLRFDPAVERVDVIERLTSRPSRQSGMFDKFSHGYLGFALGPDGRTLYYLTGGVIYENGRPLLDRELRIGAQGKENVHLVTFDLRTHVYRDHGAIFLESGQRPEYVQSIGVGKDGSLYALATVQQGDEERTDLMLTGNLRLASPTPSMRKTRPWRS